MAESREPKAFPHPPSYRQGGSPGYGLRRQLLDQHALRSLLPQRGVLSGIVIDEAPGMPSTATYASRFQSLRRAYELIGQTPARDYSFLAINRALGNRHQAHLDEITDAMAAVGASVVCDPATDLLIVNHEFTVALTIARCREDHSFRHFHLTPTQRGVNVFEATHQAGHTKPETTMKYTLLSSEVREKAVLASSSAACPRIYGNCAGMRQRLTDGSYRKEWWTKSQASEI